VSGNQGKIKKETIRKRDAISERGKDYQEEKKRPRGMKATCEGQVAREKNYCGGGETCRGASHTKGVGGVLPTKQRGAI